MITLRVKNKTLISMDKVLDDAAKKGGIAESFVIDSRDAANFLREANVCKNTVRNKITFSHDQKEGQQDIRMVIWGNKELSFDSVETILQEWLSGHLKVNYLSVPVMIENPPRQLKGEK